MTRRIRHHPQRAQPLRRGAGAGRGVCGATCCCTNCPARCACCSASSSRCSPIGPILNVRFGPRPSHYALSLLAAVAGAAVLDAPGAVAHHARRCRLRLGPARLSLLYLGPDRLCRGDRPARGHPAVRPSVRRGQRATAPAAPGAFATSAVWLVIGLTALNVVSTLLECGFGACADNPVVYELLKRGA